MCRPDEKPLKNMGSDDTGRITAIVSGVRMLAPTSRPVPSTVRAQRVAVVLICIVAVALGVTCYQSGEASPWWIVGARQEGEGFNAITRELQAEAPNRRPWRRRIERATPSSPGGQENEDEVSASPRGPQRKCWRALCGWIFRNRRDGRSREVSASGEAELQAEAPNRRPWRRRFERATPSSSGGQENEDEVSASPRGPLRKCWRTLCSWIFRNRRDGRSREVSASGETELQAEAPNRRPWRRRIERATPSSPGGQENEDEVSSSPRGPLRKCWRTLCSWIFRNRRDERSREVSASGEAELQAEAPNRRPWRRRIERATPSSSGGQENEDEVSASPRGPLRKCWQTLCSWIFRNRRDGRSGEVSASGEAEVKARVLEEFRELVKRHPGQLRRRARKVRHELDDVLLVRYLDVGLWSLKAGGAPLTEAIENTVRWREEVGPHLITDRDVSDEARDGKMYVRGHDRDGRPIIFYTPALEKNLNTQEELKLLYHTLEKATALLPHGQTQFAIVADCAGFGPSKVHTEMINTAFSTLQEHYPMRLGYVIIVNASAPITFGWKLISSALSDPRKDKIVIVPRTEAAQALGQRIDPLALPSTLPGGLDSFRYSNEAYLST